MELESQPRRRPPLLALFVAIFMGVVAALLVRGQIGRQPVLLKSAAAAPPMKAEGWFNGQAPTEEDLAGKVVVVDVWASW